jgi:DNA replication protein DnaC
MWDLCTLRRPWRVKPRGYALIERGKRVLFVRTTDMIQRLQAARRDLVLPAVLAKLDKFDAVVLDNRGYLAWIKPRRRCCSS